MSLFCEVDMFDLKKLSSLIEELERIQFSLSAPLVFTPPKIVDEMQELMEKLRLFNEEQKGISFEASKESPIERVDAALSRALAWVENFRRHHAEKITEQSLTSLIASLLPQLELHVDAFAGHLERWKKESKISLNRVGHVHSAKPF